MVHVCIEKGVVRKAVVTVTVLGSHMVVMFTNLLRVTDGQGIVVIGLLGVKIRSYFVHIQSDLRRTKSSYGQQVYYIHTGVWHQRTTCTIHVSPHHVPSTP